MENADNQNTVDNGNNPSSLEDSENSSRTENSAAVKEIDIEALVLKQVDEKLKPIKESLNNAYAARDEALAKAKAYEKEKKEAEIKKLEEEGQIREAFEKRLKAIEEEREHLLQENTKLSRDVEVNSALSSLEFRNPNARDMATREIVSELVRSETGKWLHKTGIPISDYIKEFASREENSFLFKPKVSTGSGSTGPSKPSTTSPEGRSLFEMSQEEVLNLAAQGKLPRRT